MHVKVTIGIPVWGNSIPLQFFAHFGLLQKPQYTEVLIERTTPLARARNKIVEQAKGEFIFFLDCDVLPPQNVIPCLLSHDKDIVSGLYFSWKHPYTPQMYRCVRKNRYLPIIDYPQGLVEADGIGMGCALIRKSVFKALPKPYFSYKGELGEDLYLCKLAKSKGFKIFVDTTVKCGHIVEATITEEHFKSLRPYMKEASYDKKNSQ